VPRERLRGFSPVRRRFAAALLLAAGSRAARAACVLSVSPHLRAATRLPAPGVGRLRAGSICYVRWQAASLSATLRMPALCFAIAAAVARRKTPTPCRTSGTRRRLRHAKSRMLGRCLRRACRWKVAVRRACCGAPYWLPHLSFCHAICLCHLSLSLPSSAFPSLLLLPGPERLSPSYICNSAFRVLLLILKEHATGKLATCVDWKGRLRFAFSISPSLRGRGRIPGRWSSILAFAFQHFLRAGMLAREDFLPRLL